MYGNSVVGRPAWSGGEGVAGYSAQGKPSAVGLTLQEQALCLRVCGLVHVVAANTELGARTLAVAERLKTADAPAADASVIWTPLPDDAFGVLRDAFMVYGMVAGGHWDALQKRFGIAVAADAVPTAKTLAGDIGRCASENGLDTRAMLARLAPPKRPPGRKLYIADCHFFHEGLNAHMDRRGFADWRVMNAHMEACWNAAVTERDDVFILGDFSIARGGPTNELLRRLHGKKYLVSGNHDSFLSDKAFDSSLFQWVRPYAEIRDNGRRVVLSHYPVFCYNGQYRRQENGDPATYMLYGHVHDTHDERLVDAFIRQTRETIVESRHGSGPIPCHMINCFCMFSRYAPLTLDAWIVLDARRRAALRESHP